MFHIDFRAIDADAEAVKLSWNAREIVDDRNYLYARIADWFSLILFTLTAVLTVKWYRDWLVRKRGRKWLLISALVQLLLFLLATALLNMLVNLFVVFFSLVIPIIWIYQIVYALYVSIRKWALG